MPQLIGNALCSASGNFEDQFIQRKLLWANTGCAEQSISLVARSLFTQLIESDLNS